MAKPIKRSGFDRRGASPEDIFLEDLRGVLWNSYVDASMSWIEIAGRARLAYSTVRRFASGETKRPQLYTVLRLMSAIGARLKLES